MKKRLFLLIFSLVFSLILIGCNKNKNEPVSTPSQNIVDEEKESGNDKDKPNDDKAPDSNSKEDKSITNTKVRLFYFDS